MSAAGCAAGSANFEDLIKFMEEFLDESFVEYMKLKLPTLVQSMLTLAANAPEWQVVKCSNVTSSAACLLGSGSTAYRGCSCAALALCWRTTHSIAAASCSNQAQHGLSNNLPAAVNNNLFVR